MNRLKERSELNLRVREGLHNVKPGTPLKQHSRSRGIARLAPEGRLAHQNHRLLVDDKPGLTPTERLCLKLSDLTTFPFGHYLDAAVLHCQHSPCRHGAQHAIAVQ